MIRSKLSACAGVLIALLAVHQPASGQTTAGADTLPTVVLPAALDRVLRDYERHWRASDAKGLASLFTTDGFVLSSGRPPVRGRAAIQERYTGQGGPLHLRAVAFATDDTVGYIVGTYGGTPTEINEGKFILLLRRTRGAPWQIAADMDNTNRPPRPRPQAPPE